LDELLKSTQIKRHLHLLPLGIKRSFKMFSIKNDIYICCCSIIPIFIQSSSWFGLWCLTPLSTIFQLYRGGQFYWWETRVSRENHRSHIFCFNWFVQLIKNGRRSQKANDTILLRELQWCRTIWDRKYIECFRILFWFTWRGQTADLENKRTGLKSESQKEVFCWL
jgi:hypothetical protein